ncbi:5'/3'-nucleotidase SurE [Halobacterium wangiae]|uniref:5'/3'-nucleotidase SurE n=1 Tax=Halobacterium wangiae TaxID=2902623 RepID=UPI001E416D66|nr:5'/3'-nucleotidase SurE [Halobacterium wangiae]
MADSPEILVTNDDGIDAPGIRALAEGLRDVGNVTVVAPANDQSATGRAMSREVTVDEHELGYAVGGTPSDCIVAGLEALGPYPDLVVAGVNEGANLGMYVLGRSGTVSAAVEAAFFGVPAIAASLFLTSEDFGAETHSEDYEAAVEATAYLAEHTLETGVFEDADYLNVNAPHPGAEPSGEMKVTRPSHGYDMTAERNGETVVLKDRMWDLMDAGTVPDPEGTDRRAVVDGHVSVSPLTAPHTTEHHESLDELADDY